MCESTLSSLPPVAFVIVALICYFLIACLIPSSTGLAAATMGIMASLSQFAGWTAIMVTIYCMALGLAKMIAPTSIVVMTCTSAAHMSYGDCEEGRSHRGFLFVVCCVFLCVAVMLKPSHAVRSSQSVNERSLSWPDQKRRSTHRTQRTPKKVMMCSPVLPVQRHRNVITAEWMKKGDQEKNDVMVASVMLVDAYKANGIEVVEVEARPSSR